MAAMFDDGAILPNTLIPDVPTQISGFTPKNYALTYDGAVPAMRALARSLNIPAVRMLQMYKYERFCPLLIKAGITTLSQPPSHYGLSVILGGAEVMLWDAAGVYAGMARTLNHFADYSGRYGRHDFMPPYFLASDSVKRKKIISDAPSVLSASAIWQTFEAMVEVSRPDEDAQWKDFLSSTRVAWKTGTSFGFRDGWAIGCTPKHVVAVWVGNASGEGRPGLTGIGTAAPILFDIFSLLKTNEWFDPPYDEMSRIPVCRQSGHRASGICSPVDTAWVQNAGLKTAACPYHKIIHLDPSGKWQVNDGCEAPSRMVHKPWFILPPVQEWYYKSKNPSYHPLPPFRKDCASSLQVRSLAFIYPPQPGKIYVPVEIDGTPGKVIFEAAHRNPNTTIYWHLDEEFVTATKQFHQAALHPPSGKHKIVLVDENGETAEMKFEIIGKEK
jgi:penicillin-binding protein 1C